MKIFSLLLLTATLPSTLAACSSSKDKTSTPDAAMTIVDAPIAIDAPLPLGTDPTMAEVPCDGNVSVAVDYYSCASFIGDDTMRVGQTVRFTGCDGHEVTSSGGKLLVSTGTAVCYKITSVGNLKFGCKQHPARTGMLMITP